MKKLLQTLTLTGVLFFSVSMFTGCGTGQYSPSSYSYYDYGSNNPTWAPQYYMGARYYYFPDIECYYDLSSRYFVFLNNGQWIFVETISPYYPAFNLHDSYIVIVNVKIYQPWMHHQYYNSHYPRYYYRDYYDYSNIPYVRGFNENHNSAFYWKENERDKARDWNDKNLREHRRFTYSDSDRKMQDETTRRVDTERRGTNTNVNTRSETNNRNGGNVNQDATRTTRDGNVNSSLPTNQNTSTSRTTNDTRTSRDNTTDVERRTNTNYYGKPIGRPVKVEPQMRNTQTSTRSSNTSTTSSRSSSTKTTDEGNATSRTGSGTRK